MPGLPAASYFLCFAKESNQRKVTRGSSPGKSAGYPALLETTGRCGTRARIVTAQKVVCSARPQTVLADYSCRFCVTRRLSSGLGRKITTVAMAKAGFQFDFESTWIPAFAGMTGFICGRRSEARGPMRGAEQRSKRGGIPRGLSEGEHKLNHKSANTTSPSSAAARVCEQRRAARQGRRTWGRLFLGYFLLAKQKKVTSCRATPGIGREQTLLVPL